ncbi:MAG: hypothetical protein GC157_04795 [Frankiales bacterium]|nr:hypothetical protein [Frankiales bacterium]
MSTLSSTTLRRHRPATRDRASLLAQLDTIDAAGWDSSPGETLLRHVRATIVLPHIEAQGLRGPTASQAEATAWQAVWEVLNSQLIRTVPSPWGVLWVTARRAVRGEIMAASWGIPARKAWRLNHASRDDRRPPVSLEELSRELQDLPETRALVDDSPLIDLVVDQLVEFGWERPQARRLVLAVAERSTRHHDTAHIIGGWRRLAADLDLPGWQVRRLVTVLLGGVDIGLIQRLATDATFRADHNQELAAALRSTRCSWLPSPPTRHGATNTVAIAAAS